MNLYSKLSITFFFLRKYQLFERCIFESCLNLKSIELKWIIIDILDNFRYKKYFDEGKLEKSFEVCREYLNRLDELKVKYPHRNYEIATIALCSSLWGMTQACWWHLHNVMQIVLLPLLSTFYGYYVIQKLFSWMQICS